MMTDPGFLVWLDSLYVWEKSFNETRIQDDAPTLS